MKARIPQGPSTNNLLKQVQKMQDDMANLQAELEVTEYTAEAGNGMVEATVNGKHELTMVKINPDCVDPEDVEMLEDLVMAAVNSAISKAAADSEAKMGAITGGLNLPGMPGLF